MSENNLEYNVKSSNQGLVMKKENSDKATTYHDDNLVSIEMRRSFEDALKKGIYKELHQRKMISDGQLCILLKNK